MAQTYMQKPAAAAPRKEETSNKGVIYHALAVREDPKDETKSYFTRIGVVFAVKDGFKVVLNALPINGTILLLPPKDKEE
jgi:hypothetical protein